MTKAETLLAKARTQPGGLSFSEFETLWARAGWTFQRQRGSHRLWMSPGRFRLPIQNADGTAKRYQVEQFLDRFDKEQEQHAEA